MNGSKNGMSCQTGCWALAAGVGFVAFVLMLVVGSYGLIGAVFLSGLAFVVLGFLFSMIFCAPMTKHGEVRNPGPGTGVPASTQNRPGTGASSTSPAAAGASGSAHATSGASSSAATSASAPSSTSSAPEQSGTSASAPAAATGSTSADASTAESASSSTSHDAKATGAAARTSAPTAETATSEPETSTQDGPAPSETQKDAAPPAPGAAVADADAEAGGSVKPSKDLPGQRDLEGRKGSWRYEGAAKPGDGESPGSKPSMLGSPREGGKDDLKKISGIGPKLEEQVNGMGIYHFDQIAAWTEAEIAWVDDNLEGFKGRVTRDNWVGQAKTLSGQT